MTVMMVFWQQAVSMLFSLNFSIMSLFVPFLDVFNFLLDMHHSTEFFL
jgi:hypothetical protein